MHIILWNKKNQLQKGKREKNEKKTRNENHRSPFEVYQNNKLLSFSLSLGLWCSFSPKISFSLFGEPLLFWFGLVWFRLFWFILASMENATHTHARTHACNTILLAYDLFLAHNKVCYYYFFCIWYEWMFCFWLCGSHDCLALSLVLVSNRVGFSVVRTIILTPAQSVSRG